jgi:hypothetical protein
MDVWRTPIFNGATNIGIRYQQALSMAPKTHIFFAGATGMLLYVSPDLCNLLSELETLASQDILGVLSSSVYLLIPRGIHSK